MIMKLRSALALQNSQNNLPIYFYDRMTTTLIDMNGEPQGVLSPTLTEYLLDTNCSYKEIEIDGETAYFHFIRNIPNNDHSVIVIEDDQISTNLSKAFSLVTGVLADVLAAKDDHEDLVNILRISRDKLLKLVDGMFRPLYSITQNREIVSINKATTICCGNTNFTDLINKPCYSEIFHKDTVCEWCQVDEVIESKIPIIQNIKVKVMGERRVFSMTTFPILSEDGEIIEIGESLDDITREHNLIDEIKQSKIKFMEISKDKLSKIKEIENIKAEYRNLSEGYTISQDNVRRLSEALRKLIKDSTAMQILSLRKDKKSLEAKVNQQNNQIHNLATKMDKHVSSQDNLSKKSIYGIERMCNIMINKTEFTYTDFADSIEFIIQQIDMIKETQGGVINEELKDSLAALTKDIDGFRSPKNENFVSEDEQHKDNEILEKDDHQLEKKGVGDKAVETIKADSSGVSPKVSTEVDEESKVEEKEIQEESKNKYDSDVDRKSVRVGGREVRPNDHQQDKKTIVKIIKDKYDSITK